MIEEFFPRVDLTHIIDSQLAHIPGHGTPHTILFARHRPPICNTIRVVGAIKRENEEPSDPARGLVWSAILAQIDQPGSLGEFVSVSDTSRLLFNKHPWSIGGGAADLRERLEETAKTRLGNLMDPIGFMAITGEDDAFVAPSQAWRRLKVTTRVFGEGDMVRDWVIRSDESVCFMYNESENDLPVKRIEEVESLERSLWSLRTNLRNRLMFGKLPEESGLKWYEYRFFMKERYRSPLLIAFAFVATHNHFVLERGRKVFKQSAPVIKLSHLASDDDYLAILGLLNSSVSAFWLRQTCHDKGGGGIGGGIAAEAWERFLEYTGTKLQEFPIPAEYPLRLSRKLDELSQRWQGSMPTDLLRFSVPSREALAKTQAAADEVRGQMIALQEELDWECYRIYGLTDKELRVAISQWPVKKVKSTAQATCVSEGRRLVLPCTMIPPQKFLASDASAACLLAIAVRRRGLDAPYPLATIPRPFSPTPMARPRCLRA